ncbi:MAG: [FeFe] hydrogenase H-cluster radical SAM maturase HydE, partial [Candidatus Micrarchaeota archaeon]
EWLERVVARAFEGKPPSAAEVEELLALEDPSDLNAFYSAANELRRRQLKNSCCVHAIIEFSNFCRNDCAYCGIRKSNAGLKRYRMTVPEIVEAADHAVNKLGFKALVLQSGEDEHYSSETLAEIVRKIREKCGAVVFVSVGEAGEEAYEKMWEAGARGALVRFETSDPTLYAELHEGQELKERLDCIRFAAKLGFLVATGGLIGLPGQTKASLAQDVLLTKELGAEMFSFGPFIPHPQTPLASCPKPGLDDALKVIAASRLVEPDAKILVTTALEKLAPDGRRKGFMAGANSFMISATPSKHVGKYDLYPGKPQRDDVADEIRKAQQLLQEIGRAPTDFGV